MASHEQHLGVACIVNIELLVSQDVKAEKSQATARVAAASAGQSELDSLKKELQRDAKTEQSMVATAATTDQLQVCFFGSPRGSSLLFEHLSALSLRILPLRRNCTLLSLSSLLRL